MQASFLTATNVGSGRPVFNEETSETGLHPRSDTSRRLTRRVISRPDPWTFFAVDATKLWIVTW